MHFSAPWVDSSGHKTIRKFLVAFKRKRTSQGSFQTSDSARYTPSFIISLKRRFSPSLYIMENEEHNYRSGASSYNSRWVTFLNGHRLNIYGQNLKFRVTLRVSFDRNRGTFGIFMITVIPCVRKDVWVIAFPLKTEIARAAVSLKAGTVSFYSRGNGDQSEIRLS